MEGEKAGELLAVPGPSGMCAGSDGSVPPVPAGDSAAAVEPAMEEPMAVEPLVIESPPAAPAREPERVQPEVLVTEPVEVQLSVPAAQAAAAAFAAETVTTVRLVSEALSVLTLELAAAGEPAAGVLTGVPAAVEPAAATVAAAAVEPMAAKGERPVLANGPAAASKEYWVLNPVVGPKVILGKRSVGPAAAETAAARVKCAGEPVSGPELPPAAGRAAAETESPSTMTASVFSSSVLADGQPMGGVCRACMHSFFIDCQSLRELRITSVLRNAAIQKEMWVGSNVTTL